MSQPTIPPTHPTPEWAAAPNKRSFFSRLIRWTGIFVLVLVGLCVAAVAYFKISFYEGYDPSLPLEAAVVETTETEFGIREKITFQGLKGSTIPALFHYPKETEKPFPCLVLLYGVGMRMSAVDELAKPYVEAGYGIICPEQLGQGERKLKDPTAMQRILAFKRRLSMAVNEARRTVDYLATREDVDASKLILFGISLGAINGSTALAMEPRYQAGLLMWGGGDIQRILGRSGPGALDLSGIQKLIFRATAFLLSPADPVNRIDQISPRPLLFQNATQDEIIPRECTEAYFEKAQDPKEIIWYECGHEQGLSEEIIQNIIQDQLKWLAAKLIMTRS